MAKGIGVRGRLLVAFFGISAFVVLASAAAVYSFLTVGGVLDRITQQRMPSALNTLEIARQAEQIVAAAPSFLTVTTATQREQLSSEIAAEVEYLNGLVTGLKTAEVDASALEAIEAVVARLGENLRALDLLVANRITAYYVWKVILPLCLIIAMSWAVFWINPAEFGPQIGLSATSMLTLIAFLFATTNMLPALGYFTILDFFIGGATILVFLAMLESLTTSFLVSKDKIELALRIDLLCRFIFPLSFVVVVILVFFT